MSVITTFSSDSSINTEAGEQTLITLSGGTALNLIMSGNSTSGGNQSVVLAGIVYGQITDLGTAAQRDQILISSTGFTSSIILGGSGNSITNSGVIATNFYSSAVNFSEAFGIFTANELNRISNAGLIATTALASSTYTIEVAAANTAKTYINNSGTITSNAGKAISLGDASDSIKNTGTIFGDIKLGGGSNFFDSTTGSVHGNISGGDGGNTIKLSAVGNSVNTGLGIDYIWGAGGNDFIGSGAGDDRLHGGAGDDIFIGGSGADKMHGDTGDDSLDGGADADIMWGGAGDDRYYVDWGDLVNESADGGTGFDTIVVEGAFSFSLSGAQVKGLVENLMLEGVSGAENINGSGNDLDNIIVGNNGNNFLTGFDGNDELHGGDGNDVLDGSHDGKLNLLYGGNGDDTYYYYGDEIIDETDTNGLDRIRAFTSIDLEDYTVDEDDNDNYFFMGSIEVIELQMSDNLNAYGDLFDNSIYGNNGQNQLNGRDGADSLYGKYGNDTLTGGTGADRFYFDTTLNTAGNVDIITDFVRGTDKIYVDDALFTGVFNTGATMNAGLFRNNSPLDANDFIIYKRSTGQLFFDADGNGSAAVAVQFATVSGNLLLSAADFVTF